MQTLEDQRKCTSRETACADVVIVGGGLAGLAAAIHLARAGLQVICLEQQSSFDAIVGESLDWSAPELFAQLGQQMEELVASECATFKRHIVLTSHEGEQRQYLPGNWLAQAPWRVEVRTMHLDRVRIHKRLTEAALDAGVRIAHDKAIAFEREGWHILAVKTAHRGRILAHWFIDASGAANSMLAREFKLRSISYGPRKAAIWAHLPTPDWGEGTTLYVLSSSSQYMAWLWEIPIRPGVSSVGYVAPGADIKRQRAAGRSSAEILETHLRSTGRWQGEAEISAVNRVYTTSFVCRTLAASCGDNWIIIGEAASQSDPITGNGVTAALRHAEEGSALIIRYRNRLRLPLLARYAYNLRVLEVGRFFNSLIEKISYRPELRSQLGLFRTGRIYTVPAWLANFAYSRIRPRSLPGTVAFCSVLAGLRLACWIAFGVSKLFYRRARKPLQADLPIRGEHVLRE